MKKPCTNNAAEKAAIIADGMKQIGNYAGMDELYRRGCFRHIEDIAYARISLERDGETVNQIATHLDASYEDLKIRGHHCDRVYPPS